MKVQLNLDGEIESVSASPKYKFDGKSILVSPLVKTMFEAYLKERSAFNAAAKALKTKKDRKSRMAAQIKAAKTPAAKKALREKSVKLGASITEDNKKLTHLKSAVSAARKNAGLTGFSVINKPGKPAAMVGKGVGKLAPFKHVSQQKFDAAKSVKVK